MQNLKPNKPTSPESHLNQPGVIDYSLREVSSTTHTDNSDIYYCSTGFDITVREQQYAQSTQNSSDQPKSSYDILNTLSRHPAIKTCLIGKNCRARECPAKSLEAILKFLEDFPGDLPPITDKQKQLLKHQRTIRDRQDPLAWYKVSNKKTAYVLKAALKRNMINLTHHDLRVLCKKIEFSKAISKDLLEVMNRIAEVINLTNYHGILDRHSRSETGRWEKWHKEQIPTTSKNTKRSSNRSKRNVLNKLPGGWGETLAKAMNYDPVVDLYLASGLRPSEVSQATLSIKPDGQLVVTINGRKVSSTTGQPLRVLYPNMLVPAASRLAAKVAQNPNINFSNVNFESLRQRMRRASIKLFGAVISAYCFRHSMAGQIKAIDGPTGQRVSAVLGQRSTRTASTYGNLTGRARAIGPDVIDPITAVETSLPVRETRSMRFRGLNSYPDNAQTYGDPPRGNDQEQ